MPAKMPYVQLWKSTYRFRRRVPDDLVSIIGLREWVEALGTRERDEANRRVLPHIERTNKIIEAARNGEWPPLDDEAVELTLYKWLAWAEREDAFQDEKELVASLTKYLVTHDIAIRIPGGNFERMKREAIAEHANEFGGYAAEVERKQKNRLAATVALCAIGRGEMPKVIPIAPAPVVEVVKQAVAPTAADNLPVSQLFDKWLAYRKPNGKTPQEWAMSIRRFREVVGEDIGVRSITKAHARDFRDALLKMPRNLTNGMKKMTVLEIIAATEGQEIRRLSGAAVNKNLAAVSTVLAFGADNDFLVMNPFSGVKAFVDKKKKRLPYTTGHLKTIFTSTVFVEAPVKPAERSANFWLPMLGLLHGCRLEEMAQALVTDVKQEGDIWYIDITTLDDHGKKLKTLNAHRKVPLHAEAIRMGFLIYVEALRERGEKRLFPGVKSAPGRPLSAAFSKWWGRYNTKLGIIDPRFAFHSFRHNFKSMCRAAGLDESIHDVLTGHAGGGVGRDYGDDHPLDVLAEAMAKVTPPISLKHLHVRSGR
jgi:integrase